MNEFIVIGGDMRSLYTAQALHCKSYGFGSIGGRNLCRSKNVILPLPTSTDGTNIFAPLSDDIIGLSVLDETTVTGGRVFCGKKFPLLEEKCTELGVKLIDYFESEELQIYNAELTAEGALSIVIKERTESIFNTPVLITGYGRIGKICSRYFRALGADVYVTARKAEQLAWAKIDGSRVIPLEDLAYSLSFFDLIINTIPYPVFSSFYAGRMKKNALLLDLASVPCVEDRAVFEDSGINVIRALSLPGKTAPKSSGRIIAEAIKNIISEEDTENG